MSLRPMLARRGEGKRSLYIDAQRGGNQPDHTDLLCAWAQNRSVGYMLVHTGEGNLSLCLVLMCAIEGKVRCGHACRGENQSLRPKLLHRMAVNLSFRPLRVCTGEENQSQCLVLNRKGGRTPLFRPVVLRARVGTSFYALSLCIGAGNLSLSLVPVCSGERNEFLRPMPQCTRAENPLISPMLPGTGEGT